MTLKNVLLLCGIFGLQSLANGLTATSELRGASSDAHAANHGMTAQATSSWVVTSLYYSSNCATTTTAPFIDGAQANTCLVSTEQPNESFVYTCNADSTYTVSTYSGNDCAGAAASTRSGNYQCTPYSSSSSLLASYQVACVSGNTYALPADYIVSSNSWTSSCAGSFDFSSILNRACASYINSTTSATYSLYYDYPYSYYYPSVSCTGNYTAATFIGQDATCTASGSAGFNTIYALRDLTNTVTADGARPTQVPSLAPSAAPSTATPSMGPTFLPTAHPSIAPTVTPSIAPSVNPSYRPTSRPTSRPSSKPTRHPTMKPSVTPTISPSVAPSTLPTVTPSVTPSAKPSVLPSVAPSVTPTVSPTVNPSVTPTVIPTVSPSVVPTVTPSVSPTVTPSVTPSVMPTVTPSVKPSVTPSVTPTVTPSVTPTATPSLAPTLRPSVTPTLQPVSTDMPIQVLRVPTVTPTRAPSRLPTRTPTMAPSTRTPTRIPTRTPTKAPTRLPTRSPTAPTRKPTRAPTAPTRKPTFKPTTVKPTQSPTRKPTYRPTTIKPSRAPTRRPSFKPTACPYTITVWWNGMQYIYTVYGSNPSHSVMQQSVATASGCATNMISIYGMTVVSTNLQTDTKTYQVQYTITMEDVESQGYSSGQEAYDTVTSTMQAALADGTFTQTLQATAAAQGNTDYLYSSSNFVSYDEANVENVPVSSDNKDDGLNIGMLCGIAAAVVLLGLGVGIAYWKCCRKTSTSSVVEMPPRTSMAAPPAGADADASAPEVEVEVEGESVNPLAEAANHA